MPTSSRIDYVIVETQIEHQKAGDLRLTLISPSGTRSELASPRVIEQPDSPLKFGFMEFGEGLPYQFGLRLQNNGSFFYLKNFFVATLISEYLEQRRLIQLIKNRSLHLFIFLLMRYHFLSFFHTQHFIFETNREAVV